MTTDRTMPQFVGYWGLTDREALFTQLVSQFRLSAIQQGAVADQSVGQTCHWAVASSGLESVEPVADKLETVLATLSASGHSQPDAWVKQMPAVAGDMQLVLGRETFGRVPLYWLQQAQTLWFASRLQLLLPLCPAEIDPAALYGYSCFSYVPTPLTPIREIRSVPAGVEQVWRYNATGLHVTQRCPQPWQKLKPPIQNETAAVSELQTLLQTAVERQTADLGNEPVGVFLSGGLDSSIVAALLVQQGLKVRAYSLDLGAVDNSELIYAQQVTDFLNIPLIAVDASPQRIRAAMRPTAAALDLPFGDGVTVPLFLLNRAAAQDNAVVFNGEHGDQLFAGWTNKPLIAAEIYAGLNGSVDTFEQQYLKTFHRLHGYEAQIFQPQMAAICSTLNPIDGLQEALDPQFSTALLHRLRRANLMLKGAQNIQPRATALAFAHGLRVRSPFCDRALTDWTFRLSGELCLQGSCEKYILKRAVADWLPPEIIWRSKRGMGVPLTSWCLNELWSDLGDWLNPAVLQAQGHWQPQIAANLVSGRLGATLQGRRMGECLWLLMMWQIWRKVVLQEPSPCCSWNHPFWLPPLLWRRVNQWSQR